MNFESAAILHVQVGSARYQCLSENSDQDIWVLTREMDQYIYDSETKTDYFLASLKTLSSCWGHPLLLGNLTGECMGNRRLCTFLMENRQEIAYSAPARTALFGLNYIAEGERCGYTSPIRAGMRTAIILYHMAAQAEDPFLLSEVEKGLLLRYRNERISKEERMADYRRTISPENISRLMKMPDHPTIKNELFQLIEEVIAC